MSADPICPFPMKVHSGGGGLGRGRGRGRLVRERLSNGWLVRERPRQWYHGSQEQEWYG